MLRRVLITLAALLLLAGPASAGPIVVKLGLVAGKLQVRSTQASATTFVVTVADGRGSGAGWTLRASQPVGVAGVTARCASGSTCTLPTASGVPSGAVVLGSAKGTGMGIVTLTVTLAAPARTPLRFSAA